MRVDPPRASRMPLGAERMQHARRFAEVAVTRDAHNQLGVSESSVVVDRFATTMP
jgi:hypothetical protein